MLCFNSRTREGCDSIHKEILGALVRFNSRTREGCDQDKEDKLLRDWSFQFTHPGGVRPPPMCCPLCVTSCFNSRTREGCDDRFGVFALETGLFQFTHPGGVRRAA